MNNKYLSIAAVGLAVLAIGISSWSKIAAPKIAYVRTAKLLEGYTGMKEAKNIYRMKIETWQQNFDTLETDYQRSLRQFNMDLPRLSKEDRMIREGNLKNQEANIQQYSRALEAKAKEEDEKLTQGVLNQINTYIEEFGKKKNYTAIIGVTASGNLLYGDEGIDVTEEVLKELNKSFKGLPNESNDQKK